MSDKNQTSSSDKYTVEDLEEMQSWNLRRKILVSQARIIEWYQKHDGKVYISFSGGKDSTVLLHLVREIYPDVPAVFCDTGLEFPEIRQFVRTVDNVEILRPKMSFRKVIETYGYPLISKETANTVRNAKPGTTRWQRLNGTLTNPRTGEPSKYNCQKWKYLLDADFKVSEQCCTIMKKNPTKEYEKRTGRVPYLGLMTQESRKRKMAWLKTGCNAFEKGRQQSQPMAFWTEQDVLNYLLIYKIPYCPVYGDIVMDINGNLHTTGYARTGCVFCGFGCHMEKEPNRFQMLKKTHPKLWDYCMRPWDQGGLGMRKVLEYINVECE